MNNLLLIAPKYGDLEILYVSGDDFFFIHEHDKEFETLIELIQYLESLPE